MRVVVADDSRIQRNYLQGILKRAGHDVVAACDDGAAAVQACTWHAPDVCVLDISMPTLTGIEAGRIIIDKRLAKYVMMASSNTQLALVDQMRALGCGFVAKPYEDRQFLIALADHIAAVDRAHES